MKRLVAYSSVSHLGFVMLGLMAISAEGLTGGVYQMLNHGVSTGALFLLVGMLYERRHTRLIAEYGGIAKQVPVIATVFVIVTLSSIGLPGHERLRGRVPHPLRHLALAARLLRAAFATLAALGVILGAVYMLLLVERVFFGKLTNEHNRHLSDLSVREGFVLAPMIALIVVMGLVPQPFLAPAKPAVDRLVAALPGRRAAARAPTAGRHADDGDRRARRRLPAPLPAMPCVSRPRPPSPRSTDMTGFPTRDFVALVPVAILTVGAHRAPALRGLPRLDPAHVPGAPHRRVRRRRRALRGLGAGRRPGLRPAGDGRQLLRRSSP